jgi:hypothetical protein
MFVLYSGENIGLNTCSSFYFALQFAIGTSSAYLKQGKKTE